MPLPPIVWRRDLDRPIHDTEYDGTLDNIDGRLTAIESDPPSAVSIDDITGAGDQMTITLTDASTKTVTMPFKFFNPVTYLAGRAVSKLDVFPFNGSLYVVIYPHTMAAEFDPAANDGLGHNYYFELLPNPGNSLPDGGVLGQVLMKEDGVNYHFGLHFLPAIYVVFAASSDSDLTSTNVSDALEELEAKIAAAVAALVFDALDITFSPSSASGLVSTNVGDALDELGERVTGFTDLSGTISAVQSRDATVTALGTTGTVSLNPALGDVFSITPTGNVTLNAASAPANAKITLIITTSGTSSFNITPTTNFKSQGALATGTVNGKEFSITFVGDGTNLVETGRTVAM